MNTENVAHDLSIAAIMLDIKDGKVSTSANRDRQATVLYERYKEYYSEMLKLITADRT